MTEDQLERETLAWLADVGYSHAYGPDIAPDGPAPERTNYRQVLLTGRLRAAIDRLNPGIPAAARDDALKQVLDLAIPALLSANRHFHRLLVAGVPVQYQKDGETRGDFVRLIDWGSPHPNPLPRGERVIQTTGWRSTSFPSKARTTRAGPTSSCLSTACRWCCWN
jgi:type I restriction enzyme, R subunit